VRIARLRPFPALASLLGGFPLCYDLMCFLNSVVGVGRVEEFILPAFVVHLGGLETRVEKGNEGFALDHDAQMRDGPTRLVVPFWRWPSFEEARVLLNVFPSGFVVVH
jgi:hypothetical protein